MLVFKFRKERVCNESVMRPRVRVCLKSRSGTADVFALLDSGADRTIIPAAFASLLNLEKGNSVRTYGIGGPSEAYESNVALTFVDGKGNEETLSNVSVYVIDGFDDVVVGRKNVFDNFVVTFDLSSNRILLSRKK